MYQCDNCGAVFGRPKILRENHGMVGPPYEEVPTCPYCGEPYLVEAVRCSCCGEYTTQSYVQTDDGHAYCENCYVIKEPRW